MFGLGKKGSGASLSALLAGLCLACSGVAYPATNADNTTRETGPALLNLWFVLQDSGPVYAPYAYIVHRKTRVVQTARQQTLLKELGGLIWRLRASGNAALASAMGEWRQRIQAGSNYRTPGRWGPAALMSSPRNGVPVSAVAALGACQVPNWIEVWSAQGVQRIKWRPEMRLSTLLSANGILHGLDADSVTLVTPYGSILQRGVAAWDFHDIPLTPGMRIVVPMPVAGEVSVWMQKALPEYLAHLLPGDHCRRLKLGHASAHGQN